MTKLIIQIPCLNEADTLPATLRRPADAACPASTSSSGSSSTTGRATARPTSPGARGVHHVVSLPAQQGARGRVHGRHRRLPEARRRLHRQHRRGQPVQRRRRSRRWSRRCSRATRTSASATATSRPWPRCRRSKKLAAAARQLGRAAGVEHDGARHDERVPGLHARGRAADDDRLGVLLHARVDHPGGQAPHGDRARADRDEPADARVAAVQERRSRYIKQSAATIVRIYATYEPLKVFSYIGLRRLQRRASPSRCGSSTTTSPGRATGTCSR